MLEGIRGAITVDENTRQAIDQSTVELLQALLTRNELAVADLAAVIFSATADITAAYPAAAARTIGFDGVPMICVQEMRVDGSLPHCIRVLLILQRTEKVTHPTHVYLREAAVLRPDLAR